MTDKDIAIKVENLSKIYKLYDKPIDRLKESLHWRGKKYHKDFYALDDVSFEIKKGETVGIIGKNGSGKSTLLKIITGVLTQSSGNVTVNGRVSALLELGAGFNPEYTGIENIYFQGSIMGYEKHEIDAKLDDILSFADIGEFIHQPVKTYSSGMFARLAFAVAINVEPDILIVDEALSVGDMAFQNKCMAKMKSIMAERNSTIIFVSHSLSAIRLMCERSIWIDSGILKMIKDTECVTDAYEFYMNNVKDNIEQNPKNKLLKFDQNGTRSVISTRFLGERDKTLDSYIDYVEILNDGGNTSMDFKTFENIYVLFKIFLEIPLDVSIGVSIVRTDSMLEICRINNVRDDKNIMLVSGESFLTLKLENICLLSGEYILSFYLAYSDLLRTIHKVENIVKINIRTDVSMSGWRRYDGVFAINHNWIIQ